MSKNKLWVISMCGLFLSGCSQGPSNYNSPGMAAMAPMSYSSSPTSTARYTHYDDNPLKQVAQVPLSTFSLDVDTGSYANVRRFLNSGQLPEPDAVRTEEMVNYFPVNEKLPASKYRTDPHAPFIVNYELAPAPWNEQHVLLRLDVAAKDITLAQNPPANLVFLIDTSGSMAPETQLPLVKSALKLLTNKLREQDRIAIVTYSGRSEVLLPSTSGADKKAIINALDNLEADGSTNGGAGLKMAYEQAEKGFIKNGVNRIFLATDGDFNVGMDDPKAIEAMVKKERDTGVTLSTLGVGGANFNDAMMVRIADVGNGNYSYLDSLSEAQKVLDNELNATLVTVAKDVKAQLEFNPDNVIEYRQIGYEKRQLRDEDFNNDAVDAGDIGAGKHVTVLYELTLAGQTPAVDALRYAKKSVKTKSEKSNELLWVKLRYKAPQEEKSQLLSMPVEARVAKAFSSASTDMRFFAAVAAWGQKLRGSDNLASTSWQQIAQWAEQSRGTDPQGYRAEFIRLVGLADSLSRTKTP